MKINSRNLILMALVGMSSVHLMAPTAPAAKPTGNKSTTTKVYEAGKAAVGTAASAVYNAPGYLAARASGATHSAAVAKPTKFITGQTNSLASATGYQTTANQNGSWSLGNNAVVNAPGNVAKALGLHTTGQFITGNTGSLRSATAAVGDRLVNLTLPEGSSQQTTFTNSGNRVVTRIEGNKTQPFEILRTSSQSLTAAGRAAYRTPGRLAMKLGLSKDGKIISGETGSVISAATAAKTAITQTLSSIGATMTPSLGQQAAIHAIYRNALNSISSTALWTAERFNAFTRSVSEQVQRVFETKAAKEARILKEQDTWAPDGLDGAYYG